MKAVISLDVLVNIDPAGGVVPIMTAGSDTAAQLTSHRLLTHLFATSQDADERQTVAASATHTTNGGVDEAK